MWDCSKEELVVNVGVKFKRRWTPCHSGQVIVRFKRRWTLWQYGQVIVRFKCRWTLWRVGHVPSHPCNRPLTRTRWCLLQALNCQKSSWKTIWKDWLCILTPLFSQMYWKDRSRWLWKFNKIESSDNDAVARVVFYQRPFPTAAHADHNVLTVLDPGWLDSRCRWKG